MSNERVYPLTSAYSSLQGSHVLVGVSFERTPRGYDLAAAHLRLALQSASPEAEVMIVGAIASCEAMAAHDRMLNAEKKDESDVR